MKDQINIKIQVQKVEQTSTTLASETTSVVTPVTNRDNTEPTNMDMDTTNRDDDFNVPDWGLHIL